MTRNEFLMHCGAGICCCAVAPAAAQAQSGNPQSDESKRKLDAPRLRFAKLIEILGRELDPALRKRVLENLGRACAREFSGLIDKHKGNLRGFLEMGRKQWMESAEYDEKAGTLRIVDKSRNCTCPLVAKSLTPGDFCECTLGWQKEAYAAITGRPVEAELEESVLRGGSKCAFRIRIL